jgi:hypothetical protein
MRAMTAFVPTDNPVERVICGTFHPNLETHRRAMVMAGYSEEQANSYDDTGCGHAILWPHTYRCVDCGRWFCSPCIRRHFKAAIEAPY